MATVPSDGEPNSTGVVNSDDGADSPVPEVAARESQDSPVPDVVSSKSHSSNLCIKWFRSEVCCSCFGYCSTEQDDTPLTTWFGPFDAPNGRRLDWRRSFRLQASPLLLLIKFVLWELVVVSFIAEWVKVEHPGFYMAYLTRWTAFYAIVYMTLSVALSAGFLSCCGSDFQGPITTPWNIRLTWLAYSVATTHGLGVVFLFWLMEYDPDDYDLSYFTIWPHAVSFAVVLIDGNLINRVPVRLCHYWVSAFFAILWVIWSVIQAVVPVKNPYNKDHPGEDEDYIYSVMDWKDDPGAAVGVTLLTIFVAFPIFMLLFWGLSLIGRRYEIVEEQREEKEEEEEEEAAKVKATSDNEKLATMEFDEVEEVEEQAAHTTSIGENEDRV